MEVDVIVIDTEGIGITAENVKSMNKLSVIAICAIPGLAKSISDKMNGTVVIPMDVDIAFK